MVPRTQDELTVTEKRLISQMADELQERGKSATSSAVMVRLQAKHPDVKVAAGRVRAMLKNRRKRQGVTTAAFKEGRPKPTRSAHVGKISGRIFI